MGGGWLAPLLTGRVVGYRLECVLVSRTGLA